MQQVRSSRWASWQNGQVDSDDVRWLAAKLETLEEPTLSPPWPSPDIPHHGGKWAWQGYSPQLTLTIATSIVQEAMTGYLQLVQTNFPKFGDALGLYSILPAEIEGVIGRFEDKPEHDGIEVRIMLHTDRSMTGTSMPVALRLINHSDDRRFWDFGSRQRSASLPAFGQNSFQNFDLPLHRRRPATNLAYRWLARDLAAIGLLKDRWIHFD